MAKEQIEEWRFKIRSHRLPYDKRIGVVSLHLNGRFVRANAVYPAFRKGCARRGGCRNCPTSISKAEYRSRRNRAPSPASFSFAHNHSYDRGMMTPPSSLLWGGPGGIAMNVTSGYFGDGPSSSSQDRARK
jgi:hypothetical protein